LRATVEAAAGRPSIRKLGVGESLGRLAFDGVLEANRAAVLDDHFGAQRVRHDREVPTATRGAQVGGRGAFAAGLALGDVVVAHTVLSGAVEVRVVTQTQLLGGTDEHLGQLVVLHLRSRSWRRRSRGTRR
jgi:hypothetical protein